MSAHLRGVTTPTPGLRGQLALLALTLGLGVPQVGFGHHVQSGGRAAPVAVALPLSGAAGGPHPLVLDLREEVSRFAHLVDATGAGSSARFGSVIVATTTVSAQLRLTRRLHLVTSLPWGVATVRPAAGEARRSLGLADARAGLRLDLGRGWRLPLRAQLVAPTGRRDRTAHLSRTDVEGVAADGQWSLLETNADANLGAGVWALQLDAAAQVPLGARLALNLWGQWLRPVGATPERVRWGQDLLAGAQATLSSGPLTIAAGADARWHGSDTAPDGDRLGSRRELGASAALSWQLSRRLTCGARVRAPVWQRAERRALMATVSATARCRLGLGG